MDLKGLPLWPFIFLLLVYVAGMFIDIMDVDASQYASMSREMLETGEYLKLYNRYQDYLDKPPLLFWVSSLSFKLLGISNFSYKLPTVLFTIIGLWSTFKLGSLLYNPRTGYYAALVLGTCQAWFLINHDIRTDTILAASTIYGLYHLILFDKTEKLQFLVLGAIGVAGAVLTKGPIGLMVPALAMGTDFIARRAWGSIFRWQWLLMLAIVGLLISPFLYGLYEQFDRSPGKVINGMVIDSGIKFYLWTQSFGRLTGENAWRDNSTVFFFTHTFLWSFLPWSVFYLLGLWDQIKTIIKGKSDSILPELFTLGGFILPFIAFSLSNYKLPHYIYVIFPLAAITTGRYLSILSDADTYNNKVIKTMTIVQGVHVFAFALIVGLLSIISFPGMSWWKWALFIVLWSGALYHLFKDKSFIGRCIQASVLAILAVNWVLNTHVYPALLQYQSYKVAALKVREMNVAPQYFMTLAESLHSMDFYSRRIVTDLSSVDMLRETMMKQDSLYLYTNSDRLSEVKSLNKWKVTVIQEMDHFHVTQLTLKFLNPSRRPEEVKKRYLVKIEKQI